MESQQLKGMVLEASWLRKAVSSQDTLLANAGASCLLSEGLPEMQCISATGEIDDRF